MIEVSFQPSPLNVTFHSWVLRLPTPSNPHSDPPTYDWGLDFMPLIGDVRTELPTLESSPINNAETVTGPLRRTVRRHEF